MFNFSATASAATVGEADEAAGAAVEAAVDTAVEAVVSLQLQAGVGDTSAGDVDGVTAAGACLRLLAAGATASTPPRLASCAAAASTGAAGGQVQPAAGVEAAEATAVVGS